jgi:hypothetical protein
MGDDSDDAGSIRIAVPIDMAAAKEKIVTLAGELRIERSMLIFVSARIID